MPSMSSNLSQAALNNLGGLFPVLFKGGSVSYTDLVERMFGPGASALAKVLSGFNEKRAGLACSTTTATWFR